MISISERQASLELLSNTAMLTKSIQHPNETLPQNNEIMPCDDLPSFNRLVSEQPLARSEARPISRNSSDRNHALNRISPDLRLGHPQTLASLPQLHSDHAEPVHTMGENCQRRQCFPSQTVPKTSWSDPYVYQHHFQQQQNHHHQLSFAHHRHFESFRTEHSFCPIQPHAPSVHRLRPVLGSRMLSSDSAAGNAEAGNVVQSQQQQRRIGSPPGIAASRIILTHRESRQPPYSDSTIQCHQQLQTKQLYPNESRPSQIPPADQNLVQQMTQELRAKDELIACLQLRLNDLEQEVQELRWLPTGKISQIPIADMIRIMEEYGSEVSSQTFSKRKNPVQRASVVRQFRRWNPEFFRYFCHVKGEWVPKHGREQELKRRAERRRLLAAQKPRNGSQPSSTTEL